MAIMFQNVIKVPEEFFTIPGGSYQIGDKIVHFIFEKKDIFSTNGVVNVYEDRKDEKHLVCSYDVKSIHVDFDKYVMKYAGGRRIEPCNNSIERFVSSWKLSYSEQAYLFKTVSLAGIEMNHGYIMDQGTTIMKHYFSFPESRLEEIIDSASSCDDFEIGTGEDIILRFMQMV